MLALWKMKLYGITRNFIEERLCKGLKVEDKDMRDAFIESLSKMAEDDKDIFLITGDLGYLDNFAEKISFAILNVGVAEQI